jgi:hypothetical protein
MMNQYDAICLGIAALERAYKTPLQQDALEALEFAVSKAKSMRAALLVVRQDYEYSLGHIRDLLTLSQISREEYKQMKARNEGRLKIIDSALGDYDDTANL